MSIRHREILLYVRMPGLSRILALIVTSLMRLATPVIGCRANSGPSSSLFAKMCNCAGETWDYLQV